MNGKEVDEIEPWLRLTAVTSGRNVPSARFRLRQHFDALRAYGIFVNEHCPLISPYARYPGLLKNVKPRHLGPLGAGLIAARLLARTPAVVASHYYDATWLDRELIGSFYSFEGLLKRPLFFDVDDAIWIDRPFVKRIAKKAACVIVGNSYIGDWASEYCSNVEVVPTAVDTRQFHPLASTKDEDTFVIGWTGSHGNLKYLYKIESVLVRFLQSHSNATIKIICDKAPQFSTIRSSAISYVPWTPKVEALAIRSFDVGIMPLSNGDWERGKCSFKMIQYMATGIPCVVSDVGMNREILAENEVGIGVNTQNDWLEALETLYEHPGLGRKMGREGRKIALARFSAPVVSRQLADIFKRHS